MKKIDGRVKTIITVSHFATDIVRPRAELAKSLGADIIMMMPPYHGALLKGNPDQIFEQFNEISNGEYANMLFSQFSKERVQGEMNDFLSKEFFPRFGGGIGMTRMIRALKLSNLI